MKKCNINNLDCTNSRLKLGLCSKHYDRFKKWGDPLTTSRNMNPPDICTINGCNKKYEAKGYCQKHYRRLKKHGDPFVTSKNMEHPNTCCIKDCNDKYNSKGYCTKHYYKKYPELFLKRQKKRLTKLSNHFNMNSSEYLWANQSWSKTIKKLNNNICQVCDSIEDLCSHHILHKRYYPQLSLNVNNGITLCQSCHYEVHGWK